MNKTVGIVGLGIMGSAIARNLVERGWKVVGSDIDAARRAEMAPADVAIADDVTQVARDAQIIMTSLPSPAAADDVAHENRRFRSAAADCGRTQHAHHRRQASLRSHFEERRPHCAGLSPERNRRAGQEHAILWSMPAATAMPSRDAPDLFADFAKQSADLGAYGNGSRMKFVANHLVAIHNVATAEAMVLAERAGLDPKMVVDMVGPGAGGSRMFQMRAPMMVEGVYEPATMKVSTWKKDMAIIAEFADDVGCATPLFTLTQPVYTQAMAMGLGDQDTAAVFEVLKKTIITDIKPANK